MLNPRIIEHQKHTLFSTLFPLIHFVLCNITIGSWLICARNPYPLIFFVMHAMTISCPMAEMRKVISVAMGRPMWGLEAL
jgi:hypothetical protein